MKKKISSKFIIFAVLIFLFALCGLPTAFGYLHPADPLILLASLMLPTPSALISVGVASIAADLLKGYYLLAPVTLIIKLLMVLLAKKLIRLPAAEKHPELMASPALLLPVVGYFLGELIFGLFQGKGTAALSVAAATLTKNLIQAVASVLLFIFLYDLVKGVSTAKAKLKEESEKEVQKEEENHE